MRGRGGREGGLRRGVFLANDMIRLGHFFYVGTLSRREANGGLGGP